MAEEAVPRGVEHFQRNLCPVWLPAVKRMRRVRLAVAIATVEMSVEEGVTSEESAEAYAMIYNIHR